MGIEVDSGALEVHVCPLLDFQALRLMRTKRLIESSRENGNGEARVEEGSEETNAFARGKIRGMSQKRG